MWLCYVRQHKGRYLYFPLIYICTFNSYNFIRFLSDRNSLPKTLPSNLFSRTSVCKTELEIIKITRKKNHDKFVERFQNMVFKFGDHVIFFFADLIFLRGFLFMQVIAGFLFMYLIAGFLSMYVIAGFLFMYLIAGFLPIYKCIWLQVFCPCTWLQVFLFMYVIT